MRKIFLLFILLISFCVKAEQFKLDEVELKRAISVIYEELLERPYMVDPNVLELNKKVSFYLTDDVDKEQFFSRYFDNMNIKIYKKNGVDYLKYIEPKPSKVNGVSFVYKPKYRGVEYLSTNLKDFIMSSSDINKDKSFKASINTKGDVLVIHADNSTISKIKKILPQLDIKPAQVVVTARLLEVKKTEDNKSALRIIASALKSKLSLDFKVGTFSDSLISLKTNDVNVLFGIFDTETNFNVISSPVIRVLDSETGSFVVGSDVPVLGAETYDDGVRTRSVDYRSAGVILKVKPIIMDSGLKIEVSSELSDFTKTETGVNDTPTLLKRLVETSVYMNNGSLVILGGLSEQKNNSIDESAFFLPSWLFGKSKKFEKSDIVLLLHARIVDDAKEQIDLDKLMREKMNAKELF